VESLKPIPVHTWDAFVEVTEPRALSWGTVLSSIFKYNRKENRQQYLFGWFLSNYLF
jgi:hypothetical protein